MNENVNEKKKSRKGLKIAVAIAASLALVAGVAIPVTLHFVEVQRVETRTAEHAAAVTAIAEAKAAFLRRQNDLYAQVAALYGEDGPIFTAAAEVSAVPVSLVDKDAYQAAKDEITSYFQVAKDMIAFVESDRFLSFIPVAPPLENYLDDEEYPNAVESAARTLARIAEREAELFDGGFEFEGKSVDQAEGIIDALIEKMYASAPAAAARIVKDSPKASDGKKKAVTEAAAAFAADPTAETLAAYEKAVKAVRASHDENSRPVYNGGSGSGGSGGSSGGGGKSGGSSGGSSGGGGSAPCTSGPCLGPAKFTTNSWYKGGCVKVTNPIRIHQVGYGNTSNGGNVFKDFYWTATVSGDTVYYYACSK